MRSLKTPTGQVARWLQELSSYNLIVTHRAGKSHNNADALSRVPCKSCARQQEINDGCEKDELEPSNSFKETSRATTRQDTSKEAQTELTQNQSLLDGWDASDIMQEQTLDPGIGLILAAKNAESKRPDWVAVSCGSAEIKTLWRQWDRLKTKAGMLYREFTGPSGNITWQLVIPKTMREKVLQYHHDIPSAGHLGYDKTLDKIRQSFYWPGMSDHVKQYCKRCDACTARNLSRDHNKAPLGKYLVGEPMERVTMDIMGPLPVTKDGNRYILVITDWFTKWTEGIPMPDQEAKTLAAAVVNNFVVRFGVPLQIYTDQGRNFESTVFSELCKYLNIEKTHSTSMRPQANGLVERFNRTLTAMLSKYCQENQHNWDILLPLVMMAYRSSTQSSTKFSPNKMVFGRDIILPMSAVVGRPLQNNKYDSEEDYISGLREEIIKVHDLARENIGNAATYQKRHYDTNSKQRRYKQGQLVWLHDPTRKRGVCSKLINKWKGPFLITKALDDLICLVKRSPNLKPKAYHIDRLWPYSGLKVPSWIKKEVAKLKCDEIN